MPFCGLGKKSKKKQEEPYLKAGEGRAIEESVPPEQLQKLRDENNVLTLEVDRLKTELKEKNNKLRVVQEELKSLKDQQKANNDQGKTAKATKSDLPHHDDDEKAKISKELQSIKDELEKVKREEGIKNKEIERLKKNVEAAHQKVAELQKSAEGKDKDETDAMQKLKADSDGKLTEIIKKSEELKQAKDQLEVEKNRVSKLEEENDKLKRDRDSKVGELARTAKELELARKESHIPRSPTRAPSDEWKSKIETAESELKKERDLRLEKEKEITRVNNEKDLFQKDTVRLQSEEKKLSREVQDLHAKVSQLESDLKNLEMNKKNDMKRLEDMIADYKKKLAESEAAKDQLLTRLSSQTAAHVLDNNPNVSDLSDPNRPQKLGEQLAQVYDDQWTDATEALEKIDKNEEEILKILLDLLTIIYKHCQEAAESQLSRIEEDLFLPPLESHTSTSGEANGQDAPKSLSSSKHSSSKIPRFTSHKGRPALPNISSEKKTIDNEPSGNRDKDKTKRSLSASVKGEKLPEIPTEVRKGIKEYRKKIAKQVWPIIEKEVLTKLKKDHAFDDSVTEACMSYIKKCLELCWLMRVQDPPVCLKWDVPSDDTFDSDVYRAYTKSGSHVDYVVWPAMYLYEGGPILMKGVAQGCKK